MNRRRNMVMAGILKESQEIKFKMKLPAEIELLNQAFTNAGHKIYVVGGAVRDSVLGKEPKDYDVTTKATPEEVTELLNNAGIKTLPIGEQFGVILALVNGEEFEIATFRSEKYDGSGRRPTKVEYSTIDQDALRRDLTINALYYDIEDEKIIDLVGGVEDLKSGRVRTVGNPEDRFYEDRLRVMRAIRFKNVIGGDLDSETQKAILRFKDMPGVSEERIRKEFYSGIEKSKRPEQFLKDLYDFGIMDRMFDGLHVTNDFRPGLRNPILIIALLLRDNKIHGDVIDINFINKTLTKMKYTRDEKRPIQFLFQYLMFFKDFDHSNVSIDEEADMFSKLVSARNVVSESDLIEWANLNGLSSRMAKVFYNFDYRKSKEIPEIQDKIDKGELPSQGAEIGNETKRINYSNFISMI